VRRLVPVAGAVLLIGTLVVVALVLTPARTAPPAPADPSAGSGGARPVVDPRARLLLDHAVAAVATTTYSGVQFVSAWSSSGATSEVVDIDHEPGRGTTVRTDGTLAAPARSMTLAAAGTPSIDATGGVALLMSHYSLSVVGEATVAGRPVDVVAARRPGAAAGAPDAARFWLDRESGLVLRREVYDRHGRTTRASAFVEVTIGSGWVAAGAGEKQWSTAISTAALSRLRDQGWKCPATLPGPLSLVDARRGGADGRIVHLSYSDGIASVSVFAQRGRLDESGLEGQRRVVTGGHEVWVSGAVPRRVVWASGRTVYTVVADAPERTVDQVVAALPHRPAADGDTLGRLGRGLDRVASWFNPFS
jgi:sigma-E factor negative regulatory protein RseB